MRVVTNSLTHVSSALTNERLDRALSEWFGEELVFTHWENGSKKIGKGDSYLSDILRLKIYGINQFGCSKHVQLVVKAIPKNLSRRLSFRSDEFFKNEITFYNEVLPALLKFQQNRNVKDPFNKYSKVFFAYCDGENDVICLEDASLDNFGHPIRQEGIDLIHCKYILKGLAQFHALSFAMKDQEPEEFNRIRRCVFETYYHERLRSWYKRYWKRISSIAIDAVEKEYPNSVYVDKIRKFAVPERYDDLINAVVDKRETAVISHGDPWTNNFLFKYESGFPVDVKIIDFQLSRCATPVLDIAFMTYACTSQDLRNKHYDELLRLYHDVLSTHIRNLGSDPHDLYPWSLFMNEVKKYSYFGLASSFESTPLIVLSPEEAKDLEIKSNEVLDIDDIWQLKPFKTKEGRLREANNIVHCVDHGYI